MTKINKAETIIKYLKTRQDPFIEHQGFDFELSHSNGSDVLLLGIPGVPYKHMLYGENGLTEKEFNVFSDYVVVSCIKEVLGE